MLIYRTSGDLYCYLSNRFTTTIRSCVKRYYDCWLVCDDRACGRRSMQVSARSGSCTADGCRGRVVREYGDSALHTQLKYMESLVDVSRYLAKKKQAAVVSGAAIDGYVF